MRNPVIILAQFAIGLIIAVFLGTAIAEESYTLVAFGLIAIVGTIALLKPHILVVAAVVLFNSGLTLPQFYGKLNLFHLSAAAVLGVTLLRYAFDKSSPFIVSSAHRWLLAFGAVVGTTMFFRGAGLRVLGDEKWGGMFYIQLFLCMSLVYTLPRMILSHKTWRTILLISLLAAFLPAIAGYLIIGRGGVMGILSMFIQADSQVAYSIAAQMKGGVVRQTAFSGAGQSLFNAVLLYFPINMLLSVKGWIGLGIVAVSFLLVGLSGYRTAFISMFLTAGILMFWNRSFTAGRVMLAVGAAVTLYAIALLFGQSFPPAIQRMLSILPGVEVQQYVIDDATSTVSWRFELWGRGIEQIPDYWLIGKGYAFSGRELLEARNMYLGLYDPTDWAVVTSSYHQGVLSLIIGLGLPGLVTGLTAFYLFVRRHYRFQKEEWISTSLKLCHQVMTAYLAVGLIKYVFIYGDVQASFPEYFYVIAILEAIWASNRKALDDARRELKAQEAAVIS